MGFSHRTGALERASEAGSGVVARTMQRSPVYHQFLHERRPPNGQAAFGWPLFFHEQARVGACHHLVAGCTHRTARAITRTGVRVPILKRRCWLGRRSPHVFTLHLVMSHERKTSRCSRLSLVVEGLQRRIVGWGVLWPVAFGVHSTCNALVWWRLPRRRCAPADSVASRGFSRTRFRARQRARSDDRQ